MCPGLDGIDLKIEGKQVHQPRLNLSSHGVLKNLHKFNRVTTSNPSSLHQTRLPPLTRSNPANDAFCDHDYCGVDAAGPGDSGHYRGVDHPQSL